MTAGMLPWGVAAMALCIFLGALTCWPVAYRRGWDHAAEEAEWQQTDARWKGLEKEADRPVPVRPAGLPGIATPNIPPAGPFSRPPAPPDTPRAGRGKHRHPAGPPQHAALPAAGYLPAPDGPWNGTITVPAPVQSPPWETRPEPEPEPPAEVLEPTAADCLRPDALTDTGWTRQMAADMDAWIYEHITATDSTLKQITGGAR
jgi:hypothetical protein